MAPRELTAGPPGGPRALLVHGLSGSPTELWPLAVALAEEGFRALLPLLPGHGGKPEALREIGADDLVSFVRELVEEPPALLVGTSMGALLALAVAPALPDDATLVLLAPAVTLKGASRIFQLLPAPPFARRLLVPKKTFDPASMPPLDVPPPIDFPRLDQLPLGWGRELRRLRALARAGAGRVRARTLVVHGAADETADASSALTVATWLGSRAEVALVDGGHQLVLGASRDEVVRRVLEFVAPENRWPKAGRAT